MITTRYYIGITFQKADANGRLRPIGKARIDATEILSWPAEKVDALTRAFDDQQAPSIESLPCPFAGAIRAAHDGPIAVTFGLIGYLASLQVIDWERVDLDKRDWFTDDILAQARARIGYTEPDSPLHSFGDQPNSRVFEIDGEFVPVIYDGRAWRRISSFANAASAQWAAAAALENTVISQKRPVFDLRFKVNGYDPEGEGFGYSVRGFVLDTSPSTISRNTMIYVVMPQPDAPACNVRMLQSGNPDFGVERLQYTDTVEFRGCRWIGPRTIAAKSYTPLG